MVKKLLLTSTLVTAFSAIAVSARQLTIVPSDVAACGSPCNKSTTFCKKPCLCFVFGENQTTGICQPEGPSQLRK